MWIVCAFIAAVLSGGYDISKKLAVNNNVILVVLFLSTVFSTLLIIPFGLSSWFHLGGIENSIFYIPSMNLQAHLFILGRASIIVSAWLMGYSALKYLPITIVGPINATRPIMTLILAILLFNEKLNMYQWIGVLITIGSLISLSFSSKQENIKFTSNKWVALAFLGALAGSISELFERQLMLQYNVLAVQLWTSIYQCCIIGLVIASQTIIKKEHTKGFEFRYSIFCIALFLTISDFVYLFALKQPDAMISIVSLVRRGSVFVTFLGGVFFFNERNIKSKAIDLCIITVGLIFLFLGSPS